jgi:hypothetical protein
MHPVYFDAFCYIRMQISLHTYADFATCVRRFRYAKHKFRYAKRKFRYIRMQILLRKA